MFDPPANPSDGRFEGSDPVRSEPAPRRSSAWGALAALVYLLPLALHSTTPRGWLAAVAGLAAFGLGVAEFVLAKKRRDEAELRSSSQRITR